MTTAGTSLPTAKPGSLDEQLLSRDFLQDPYPTHRRLRREDPVHWCEPWRMWMVSRYEDVRTVLLKDGTTFSAVGQTSAALAHLSSVEHSQLESLQRIFSAGLLWSDPPDHTRIRSAVNKALTPHDAERMRPRLDGIIASVVDELPVGEAFDFVERVAAPVPVSVLAALLGIRDEDVPRFRAWADTLAAFIGSPRPTADLALAAQACVLEAGEFIGWLRERRRREPTDDVITRLVTEPRALVLHAPVYNPPVFLTGRRSLLGYPGSIWSRGLDSGQRERDIQKIYSGAPEAASLLRRNRVNYVLLGPLERQYLNENNLNVNEGFWSQFPVIAQSGEYRLYKIEVSP